MAADLDKDEDGEESKGRLVEEVDAEEDGEFESVSLPGAVDGEGRVEQEKGRRKHPRPHTCRSQRILQHVWLLMSCEAWRFDN